MFVKLHTRVLDKTTALKTHHQPVNSMVSHYKLTQEQMANYKKGMDLGTPYKVEKSPSLMKEKPLFNSPTAKLEQPVEVVEIEKTVKKGGRKQMFFMSKNEYIDLRAKGRSKQQIAIDNKVSISTIKRNVRKWGLDIDAVEQEAIEQYKLIKGAR